MEQLMMWGLAIFVIAILAVATAHFTMPAEHQRNIRMAIGFVALVAFAVVAIRILPFPS